MITGIKQRAVVGKGGKIEIPTSELSEGTTVEIIVLVEQQDERQDLDETEYLLSTDSNRTRLLQALERAKHSDNLVVITSEEWHEQYSA
jgi:antitoxin YefM